jgi:hypothetical protein
VSSEGEVEQRRAPAGAPDGARNRAPEEKSVWVISYSNAGNFGDRLGVQLLSQALPAHASVRQIHHVPFDAPPEGEPDLLVVGIGNSMFASLLTDDFARLLQRARRVVGIFGTQYREVIPPNRFRYLMETLDVWFARSEEDLALHGGLTKDARHLGDWLIDLFPMARGYRDDPVDLRGTLSIDAPLDRYIEHLQQYRRVKAHHMHAMLCALTSAEEITYLEQTDLVRGQTVKSGKFRSLLLDIFGREHPPELPFQVDRRAVVAYKAKVRHNIAGLRDELARLLA